MTEKSCSDHPVPTDRTTKSIIFNIGIFLNFIVILLCFGFYLLAFTSFWGLRIVRFEESLLLLIASLPMLIIATFSFGHLKYLKKYRRNASFVIATPVAVLIYFITMFVSRPRLLGENWSYILAILELAAATAFIIVTRRRKQLASTVQTLPEKDCLDAYVPVIRFVSISLNLVMMLPISFPTMALLKPFVTNFSAANIFYIAAWWIYACMAGLAPFIITTYFLWYLKHPRENLFGIFVVTPIVHAIHFLILYKLSGGFAIIIFHEPIAAIAFVVIARRKGYVRNRPADAQLKI